jgi:hypothetical protein
MFDFNKFIHIDRIVPRLGFGEDYLVRGSNNSLQCVNKRGIGCKASRNRQFPQKEEVISSFSRSPAKGSDLFFVTELEA